MGCDIHMYIEKKIDGKWIPAQGFMHVYSDDRTLDVPYADRFTDRDYLLFGFLAGVRDCTNQHFVPKGFPKDASKEVSGVYNGYGSDAHTPSYLTLKELQSVDWDNEMITIGREFLKHQLETFRKSVTEGTPHYDAITTWCSWASDKENWEYAEIEVPIKYQFMNFYRFMNKLNSYDFRCNENEIRIVFWFDN